MITNCMDKTTEKIKEEAQRTIYLCNLLIEQCNSWAQPPTPEEYRTLQKEKEQTEKNKKI